MDRTAGAARLSGYLAQAVRSLVEALEEAPQRQALQLQVLPEQERRQILEGFNATEQALGQVQLLHGLFEQQVARTPDAVALVCGVEQLSYAQLNRRANQLAHHLRSLGVGPDVLVGLCVERSVEMLVGVLGILKAGGAYVPLDPAYPTERLHYMLQDTAAPVVLIQEHVRARLLHGPAQLLALDAQWGQIAAGPDHNPGHGELHPRNLAYVIYTSGSTGQPKGAMNEHRGVVNRLRWMQRQYALGPDEGVLQKTPISFDVSVWELLWPLLEGARLVMARPRGHQDPHYVGELIQRMHIGTVHFVPAMLESFLHAQAHTGCASLRRIVCSGEELKAELQQGCLRSMPHARLYNLYGPTEAAIDVTHWTCQADHPEARVPIGKPISNTRLYILDTHGAPVPIGVSGEIYIAGVGVARGYLNRPELTAERFVKDPFSTDAEARMYRSGDLGRWRADGNIEYLGRNDQQVKIRGYRIELGEIEARLREHEQVREAVVLAREDVPGERRLVGYVVPAPGQAPSVEALRAHLARHLPEYMVPAAMVMLEQLPLSANGKIDRKGLPAPGISALQVGEYEPPQGELEEALAQIWQELLQIERVGRHDNFFELGGHSLLIVQMIGALRRIGLTIEMDRLFESPTLEGVAAVLKREREPDAFQARISAELAAIPEGN